MSRNQKRHVYNSKATKYKGLENSHAPSLKIRTLLKVWLQEKKQVSDHVGGGSTLIAIHTRMKRQ